MKELEQREYARQVFLIREGQLLQNFYFCISLKEIKSSERTDSRNNDFG